MKLEDVKFKIDNYFEKTSAEDILDKLTNRFGMQEYNLMDSNNIPDESIVGNAEIA